jgi:hypothetical protein
MRSLSVALTMAAMIALPACSPSAPASAPSPPTSTPQTASVANLGQRSAVFEGSDPTAYSQWLASQAIAAEQQKFATPCAALAVSSLGDELGGSPIISAPPPGAFIDSTYVENLQVAGCGRTDIINLLILRLTSGAWMQWRMLDGESLASPGLQRDGLRIAAPAFAAAAQCPSTAVAAATVQLGVSKVVQAPPQRGDPWQELWSASLCGKSVTVQVTFTPNASGGADISVTIPQPGGPSPG